MSVTLTRESAAIIFLFWQPCTGDSVDGTCIERLVQNADSSWSCCYIAEFWLDGTLLLFEFEPSCGLCPDSQLRAYSTGLAYSTGGYGFYSARRRGDRSYEWYLAGTVAMSELFTLQSRYEWLRWLSRSAVLVAVSGLFD